GAARPHRRRGLRAIGGRGRRRGRVVLVVVSARGRRARPSRGGRSGVVVVSRGRRRGSRLRARRRLAVRGVVVLHRVVAGVVFGSLAFINSLTVLVDSA